MGASFYMYIVLVKYIVYKRLKIKVALYVEYPVYKIFHVHEYTYRILACLYVSHFVCKPFRS